MRSQKKITLKRIGYMIHGEAEVILWGGGTGTISMDKTYISRGELSKERILRAINGGQFGVKLINIADLCIYDVYHDAPTSYGIGKKYEKYNRSFLVNCRILGRRKFFNLGI